ncbi:MAG: hypothetical protein NC121_03225 [Blautia sp.]|nr:hypothetical protein [Blautia sp.]
MAVMDEFREEREALKHGTPKQKFTYFMDYYKWYVIIAVIVIILGVYTVREIMDRKDTALYTCLLNTIELEAAQEYNAEFAETIELDTDKYRLTFDANIWIDPDVIDENTMVNSQKLMAHLAAGELDIMITDQDSITNYAYQDNFLTMEELLPPELYEKYAPYFYYIDLKTLEEWNVYISDPNNLTLDMSYDFPDPRKPEEMERPMAIGIFLDECEELRKSYYFQSDDVVFSVFGNTSRVETVLRYLEYLTDGTE